MKSTTSYTYKDIWLIAYPILISLIMEQMIGITDTAFLGHVGEIELGASAIAGVYYLAIFMIGFGFTVGSQILIARRNGEGNYRAIGNIFYQGIYFLMLMSLVIFILSQVFSEQILGMLVSSDRIVGAATDYIRWRVYGFFFSFIGAMFRAFFVGTTQTRTLTLNSIVMAAANVIFNYTLIFGKFGFPAMGIAGAAIGSSLAELVSVLFFISYTYRKIDYRKYGLNRIPGIRTKALSQIMHISLWTMIQNFISLSTWFLFFIFIEHLGERPLAISNIIRSVSSIPFMTVMSFASTCSSLVSNQIGAGHSKEVPALINQHIRLCSFFVIPLIGLIALFPSTVLRIYTNIPDLITASIPTLWVLCSTYIVSIPGFIYFQSVSGTGNTRAAFILEIIALALYTIYILIVITGLKADVAICWTAEHLYAICIGIASYLYIRKANWQHKRI
ncbi:MATE family efflux transporter [Phocaeicola coprocola]|uniref:MATE family efflux transporter n=1 Tax=Phocaeicola coprocola TaxID=310298 RepID=UPI00266F5D4B|nr:MATE family efflux transporter [Phocaeicola coprocola]